MSRTITPSAREAQEIAQFLDGQSAVPCGEELLSALIRLATERVLQETREQEQTEARGRGLYARQETSQGYRTGYAEGTLKTAEGILRLPLPPVRGRREPYRSKLWAALGRTSDVLTTLIVEMYAGGMAQRDVDGRKVLLTLSTAHSESYDRCLEVLRARGQRGLQPPGTSTTAGAPGLRHAVDSLGPRALRRRGGFPQRPTVSPQVWEDASGGQRVWAVLSRGRARWGKQQDSACEPPHRRALRQG
jgi:transposase-like protein